MASIVCLSVTQPFNFESINHVLEEEKPSGTGKWARDVANSTVRKKLELIFDDFYHYCHDSYVTKKLSHAIFITCLETHRLLDATSRDWQGTTWGSLPWPTNPDRNQPMLHIGKKRLSSLVSHNDRFFSELDLTDWRLHKFQPGSWFSIVSDEKNRIATIVRSSRLIQKQKKQRRQISNIISFS